MEGQSCDLVQKKVIVIVEFIYNFVIFMLNVGQPVLCVCYVEQSIQFVVMVYDLDGKWIIVFNVYFGSNYETSVGTQPSRPINVQLAKIQNLFITIKLVKFHT